MTISVGFGFGGRHDPRPAAKLMSFSLPSRARGQTYGVMDDEIRKLQAERSSGRVAMGAKGGFDTEIYGDDEDRSECSRFVPGDDVDEDAGDGMMVDGGSSSSSSSSSSRSHPSSRARVNPAKDLLDPVGLEDDSTMAEYRAQYGSGLVNTRIADRETQVCAFSSTFPAIYTRGSF